MDQMQMAVTVCAGALVVIALTVLVMGSKLNAAARQLLEKQPDAATPAAAAPSIACAAQPREPDLHGVDEETAAMLMAITAHKLGVPPDELRFTSIKEI